MTEASSWEEFFEDFSYKPNFQFELIDYDLVRTTMTVMDSRRGPVTRMGNHVSHISWPTIEVRMTTALRPWHSERFALDHMRKVLGHMEYHELDEWFRYKGKLVHDPHATAAGSV